MDLFKELQRINNPACQLEIEAKRQMKVVDAAIAAFEQVKEQLLSAFVDKFGAAQLMEHQDSIKGLRRAWVVPGVDTEETLRKTEDFKGSDRFQMNVKLYTKACPLSPHQAQVVQYIKDGKVFTGYRLRDDVKLDL